jgi:hypothetical protein
LNLEKRTDDILPLGHTPRLIAWLGSIISGWIIANLRGFSRAAVMIALVYIVSLAAALFLPETKGKPLPVQRLPYRFRAIGFQRRQSISAGRPSSLSARNHFDAGVQICSRLPERPGGI